MYEDVLIVRLMVNSIDNASNTVHVQGHAHHRSSFMVLLCSYIPFIDIARSHGRR